MIRANCKRTVYARVSRLKLSDLLMQFDYPDANVHAEKRSVTTTPMQKLFMLNSPFMQRRAAALAARLLAGAEDDDSRIAQAYRLLFARAARRYRSATSPLAFLRRGRRFRDVTAGSSTPRSSSPRTKCFMSIDPHFLSSPGPLLDRRQMLGRMCAGFGMLGLARLLGSRAALGNEAPAASKRLPHFAPRAKRVVFLFLNGGPSHVDTFDPKPALAEVRGRAAGRRALQKEQGQRLHALAVHLPRHGQSGIEVCERCRTSRASSTSAASSAPCTPTCPITSRRCSRCTPAMLQPVRPSYWLVAALRSRHGKRKSSRLRRLAAHVEDRRRPGPVEQQLSARGISGHKRPHRRHGGR